MKVLLIISCVIPILVIINWVSSGIKSEKINSIKTTLPDINEVNKVNGEIIETYTIDKCNKSDSSHQGNCLKCNADVFQD